MSRRLRNSVYAGVIVGLLAFVVIGLIPRDSTPETAAERSHRIATQLRCPFCNGESIAEAQSSIGADLRALIDEQIASGMSDDEIFDFYVGRYTERVLLSPPLVGWGLALWLLPLIVLGGGVVALLRRQRDRGDGPGHPVMVPSAAALADARALVASDLAELDLQQAAGELDEAAADRLRSAYRAEAEALEDAVIAEPVRATRSRGRTIAGAAILAGGALALTVAVVMTVQDRAPGDLVTGGIAGEDNERTLDEVTNQEMEAVVAANPDVVPMRLALAGRYFDEGDFSAAVVHYMEVLEREQNPEALANVGWMTYLSGEIEIGLTFVERSLEITRDLPQPHWYVANIRYRGLDDAPGAVEPLQTLLAFDGLPDEIRDAATELLAEVEAAL